MRRGSRFFTHTISILEYKSTSNGMGGTVKQWVPVGTFKGFMDTPSSRSQLLAMQMQKTLDRELYYPINIVIPPKSRLKFGSVEYEQVGKPINQGGQDKYLCLQLKEV